MKKIIVTAVAVLMVLNISVSADENKWETYIKLQHIELSKSYVEAMEKRQDAINKCKTQIKTTQDYKATMDSQNKDQIKELQIYIDLVKDYCSLVAGCKNCDRVPQWE